MELLKYLTSKTNFPEPDCISINNAFKTEEYLKGEIPIKPGSFSSKVFFVEKGLIRTFYFKDDKDITQFFFDENYFTAPLSSVFYNKPEPYGWEVLEDTTVRVILYNELEVLFAKIPLLQKVFFHVAIDMLNMFSDKLESLQFQTAEQRYKTLVEAYPEILRRAPLGQIASYLGITQQTLSVIRAKR